MPADPYKHTLGPTEAEPAEPVERAIYTPPPGLDLLIERAESIAAELDVSLVGDQNKAELINALAHAREMLNNWPKPLSDLKADIEAVYGSLDNTPAPDTAGPVTPNDIQVSIEAQRSINAKGNAVEPAFPATILDEPGDPPMKFPGITKLELFKLVAMHATLSLHACRVQKPEVIARETEKQAAAALGLPAEGR